MKKYFTKEISIALITIISGVILYAGLNYMKGTNVFKHTNYYYVKMPNVNELQKASPVYVDGFKVGLVNDIDFGFDDHKDIVVKVNLDKKMKVQIGSYFLLKSGLTSGAFLDLVPNKYVGAYCQVGDTLDGTANIGMMDKISSELLPQFEKILPRLDSILMGIQTLVNHPALSQSLDRIAGTTANLENASRQLNGILTKDIPPILSNLDRVSSDFAELSHKFKQIDINSTMNAVDRVLEGIDQMAKQLNDKNNSMGLLLNDRSLYDNLDSTAENASKLLLDLRENPKRYVHFSVFSKK
jgi:phospholipid/cholesterol/gamma-HCH transport system substrate-binding protein